MKLCASCYASLGRPKSTCRICGNTFAADSLIGRRCRQCVSDTAHGKRIVELYGLTAREYHELLDYQNGRCWICRRRPASKRLAVDHDHETGAVRGLLCKACNRDILGHLRDDTLALLRAVDYLHNPPARHVWPDRVITPEETP